MNKYSYKKILTISILGSLTFTSITGCYWQTNKYKQSKKRWDRLTNILKNFNPLSLDSILNTLLYN